MIEEKGIYFLAPSHWHKLWPTFYEIGKKDCCAIVLSSSQAVKVGFLFRFLPQANLPCLDTKPF